MLLNIKNRFTLAVILSTTSLIFGIFREFLIVYLFGFTAKNDNLQLYLSIFYTIGLSIDAMRLACLNLYSILPLSRIITSATTISLLFSIMIGMIMSYFTGGLNPKLLAVTIIGCYLNLIAALLITYKQRHNSFLLGQIINVLPNFILIPGILICYWTSPKDIIFSIILLTSAIPLIQCLLLLLIRTEKTTHIPNNINFTMSLWVFIRHFSATLGEQLFQLITRTAFFEFGTGYLSMYAITIRVYAAIRFILVDSFIGSKLSHWHQEKSILEDALAKIINFTFLGFIIAAIALLITTQPADNFLIASLQITALLILGFYFSTLVRIVYFKINQHESNNFLIIRFALFELACAMLAFLLTKELDHPILAILWLGYIAKPFAQLLILRKKYRLISSKESG